MTLLQWVEFPIIGDGRGALAAIESGQTIPFEIKRIYYIFATQRNVSRGFHAHKSLKQVAVCVAGKCRMVLDNGKEKESFWLDSPSKGVLIGNMVWREMHDFGSNCVLVVLASAHYDESDYIRNYDDFIHQVKV